MSDVITDASEGVGTIMLNRPDRRNALSDSMIQGVAAAMKQMEADPAVGAIVLTGAGNAFCSGGDVQGFHESGGEGGGSAVVDEAAVEAQRQAQEETVGRIYRCAKPVLASIPGAVAGAGIGLALAADLRIGSTRTVFATAFGGVGLAGDFGVAWLLHQLVGPALARELLFLNPRIRGEQCADLGLVNWIVAEDELETKTRELATKLASGSSHALSGMKQNLLRAPGEDLTASMHAEVPLHKATGLTNDHVNAVKAFVNKEASTFPVGWHAVAEEETTCR
ncbi:enoyl-CoA hydratase/isomerase family protein [Nocardioides albus]|uniref:2-(1,2-epoxy-1,2-dihydrophenyl)acetyl-CoA isomerase n=1 Tax=Nocardioides albus TaxID=1841 RepID=A0A7W5A3U4_9ACTN|nr:enoyl-CoA hydratase-related protein [Nocardioides albus]MBB3088980.1 2-(1,2-epoxy-1,2-dihydrophenyl)acetyl-CoA isomerase [Nocardioides albus]GGU15046.1 enoyl-CoA hydratase [Nocardioides albus]